MNVSIIKIGRTVPVITKTVRPTIDGTLTYEEMKNEAWKAAVHDGDVKDDERQQYWFVVKNE